MRSVAPAFPDAVASSLPVWRADQLAPAVGADAVRPTGHAALDAELPGGGWPAAGLIELLLPAPGCGELRLLAPALAGLPVLWVAPPLLPYAPALAALGLAADRITVATPAQAADAAWAAEQALRSGVLGAVLWWQGAAPVLPATLRRLHLAAVEGRTPLFALRPAAARAQSSPAPLRLALDLAGPSHLVLDLFKRRGPPLAVPLHLSLPGPAPRRAAPAAAPATTAPIVLAPASVTDSSTHAVVRAAPERAAA